MTGVMGWSQRRWCKIQRLWCKSQRLWCRSQRLWQEIWGGARGYGVRARGYGILKILVSAQVPLVFLFLFLWVWALRVWGLGLTIFSITRHCLKHILILIKLTSLRPSPRPKSKPQILKSLIRKGKGEVGLWATHPSWMGHLSKIVTSEVVYYRCPKNTLHVLNGHNSHKNGTRN